MCRDSHKKGKPLPHPYFVWLGGPLWGSAHFVPSCHQLESAGDIVGRSTGPSQRAQRFRWVGFRVSLGEREIHHSGCRASPSRPFAADWLRGEHRCPPASLPPVTGAVSMLNPWQEACPLVATPNLTCCLGSSKTLSVAYSHSHATMETRSSALQPRPCFPSASVTRE